MTPPRSAALARRVPRLHSVASRARRDAQAEGGEHAGHRDRWRTHLVYGGRTRQRARRAATALAWHLARALGRASCRRSGNPSASFATTCAGMGSRAHSSGEFTIEQLGRDALAVLDAAGAPSAAVCGISIGGVTGIWLGQHASHHVKRLVLANTAARIGTSEGWSARMRTVRETGMRAGGERRDAALVHERVSRAPAGMSSRASRRSRVRARSRATLAHARRCAMRTCGGICTGSWRRRW